MRVLITGGAGFKGCVLTETLLRAGYEVTVLDEMMHGVAPALALQQLGARVVRASVNDAERVATEVGHHDAVIHLAALVGSPLCELEPYRAQEVNVRGTQNVVASLRPAQPLVYASTGSVYGRVEDLCDEEHPTHPLSNYGRTKLQGERVALRAGAVALRFATLMGTSACMRFDLLVNSFVYRAVRRGGLDLYQPEDRRSFLDVQDAANAYLLALEQYETMAGQVYNVGNPALNLSKREIAEAVGRQFPLEIEYFSDRPDPDQRNYRVDYQRITDLGYKPLVPLATSLDRVAAVATFVDCPQLWRFAE